MGVKKNKVIYGYVRCEKKICVNKYKPLKVPKILIGKQKCQICKNIMQKDDSKHIDAVYKLYDKSKLKVIDYVFKNYDLKKFHKREKFFHIGPPRDFDLFNPFKKNKSSNLVDSEYLLCTGLFDDHDKDLNYYKNLLEAHIHKKMICTNPDLIVDRGNIRELCAGSVAMVFEKMGGEVVYFGKPHAEVYNLSIDNLNKRTLAIGDNLNTDLKGANLLNYDSLLISNGIHKLEILNKGILEVSKEYETVVNYTQSDLRW